MTVFLFIYYYYSYFDVVVIKPIEIAKNRVKTELEASVQVVDVKQQKFAIFFDTKHKELQQAFAKRKRFSDIWVSFDRRENDFLNQEIRTLRILDEIDPLAGLNESEPVGFEKVSINDYPGLLDFDFFQFLKSLIFRRYPFLPLQHSKNNGPLLQGVLFFKIRYCGLLPGFHHPSFVVYSILKKIPSYRPIMMHYFLNCNLNIIYDVFCNGHIFSMSLCL